MITSESSTIRLLHFFGEIDKFLNIASPVGCKLEQKNQSGQQWETYILQQIRRKTYIYNYLSKVSHVKLSQEPSLSIELDECY